MKEALTLQFHGDDLSCKDLHRQVDVGIMVT